MFRSYARVSALVSTRLAVLRAGFCVFRTHSDAVVRAALGGIQRRGRSGGHRKRGS